MNNAEIMFKAKLWDVGVLNEGGFSYYYPTDERTIQECLDGDYILLGVYNDVGVKSPRL